MYEQKMSPAPATGMVSNLQHCSVHDGPGIRTTVFLKGCNMRCQWCHNPETISFEREMLFYPEKCIGCGMCAAAVPEVFQVIGRVSTVLSQPAKERFFRVLDAANGCPVNAIRAERR